MAAITLNAAHRKQPVREQFQTVLAAFRDILDAFVSNRMRQAAAEAGHIRPPLPLGTSSPSLNAR